MLFAYWGQNHSCSIYFFLLLGLWKAILSNPHAVKWGHWLVLDKEACMKVTQQERSLQIFLPLQPVLRPYAVDTLALTDLNWVCNMSKK